MNGRIAKPGLKLKVGDIIEITFGRTILKVRVKKLAEHVLKGDASELYEVIEEIEREEE